MRYGDVLFLHFVENKHLWNSIFYQKLMRNKHQIPLSTSYNYFLTLCKNEGWFEKYCIKPYESSPVDIVVILLDLLFIQTELITFFKVTAQLPGGLHHQPVEPSQSILSAHKFEVQSECYRMLFQWTTHSGRHQYSFFNKW